jgi:hypothetical protein
MQLLESRPSRFIKYEEGHTVEDHWQIIIESTSALEAKQKFVEWLETERAQGRKFDLERDIRIDTVRCADRVGRTRRDEHAFGV